ncbi:MAG: outer membrane lipoprotein chaperone LolA [Nevskia sp.]
MLKNAVRLTAVVLSLSSAAASADSAQEALKRFVDGVQTFEAHFDQTQTDERGQVTNRSSGMFWLGRPAAGAKSEVGKFRWAYEKPYEQVSVCDGARLWAYDPDLSQVTVRSAKAALAGTPAALLSQRAALGDAFVVQDAGGEGEARIVRLIPKAKDSDFKSIELAIDKAGAPLRMRFRDQIGGSSEVRFSATKTNGRIDDKQFQFVPPKGTEVVDADADPKKAGSSRE